jgi:phage shock protein C
MGAVSPFSSEGNRYKQTLNSILTPPAIAGMYKEYFMSTVYRQLYRSRDQRMIGGICAGLGEYFNIDPTLIRLSFVFFSLIGFAGAMLIAYLVMLIVVPEEPLLTASSTPTESVSDAPIPSEE